MTLPSVLRPWWRLFKRLHRLVTLLCGVLFRALSPLLAERGVPRSAAATSAETAAREPAAVRLHPGRTPELLTRPAPHGEPAEHHAFARNRSVTVPATFTLEVSDGRLTGDFGATTTPGKVLDHETSTYFGVTDWREHPIFLRPTLGPTEQVRGTVLSLTARGAGYNYYHFVFDSIARFGVFEDCLPGEHVDAIVVPHRTRYQRELLELAGITGRFIEPARGRTIRADRLLVPSNPNWALDAPPSMVAWLRARLRPTGTAETPRRLYLTRGDVPRTRRYVHEAQLWPELERRGFLRLDPGQFSVQKQIDIFSRAEVVVSPHGAALTNVVFSDPSVRVLELFASTYVHLGLWSICQSLGASYRYLVDDQPLDRGNRNAGVFDDVHVPAARVLAAVDELLSRP
jgi:capsular polysaccharide biosynthesis protein